MRTRPPTRSARTSSPGMSYQLRIIGGEWRGRKLQFPATRGGIRPTPDRVRETLFNWLQGRIAGRRCLDLFAGSGALGLEALSRGATEVVFVEVDPEAARSIADSLARLGCDRGHVLAQDALGFLAGPVKPFDVVFVDPPYASGLLAPVCRQLADRGWLAADGLVYLEQAAADGPPELPGGWRLRRSKRAGEVGYHLAGQAATDPA